MPRATATASAEVVDPRDEDHGRHDRAGAGEQRRAEGHEARRSRPRVADRLVALAGEQLQRDEQEQQAAGALQRGQRDVQVVEDALTEDGEGHDDESATTTAWRAARAPLLRVGVGR